jgi:hypothetical protein
MIIKDPAPCSELKLQETITENLFCRKQNIHLLVIDLEESYYKELEKIR